MPDEISVKKLETVVPHCPIKVYNRAGNINHCKTTHYSDN